MNQQDRKEFEIVHLKIDELKRYSRTKSRYGKGSF